MAKRDSAAATVTLEDVLHQVAELEAERINVERAGPGLEELIGRAEGELDTALDYYLSWGFSVNGITETQVVDNNRLATIGCLVALNGDALRKHARERAQRLFDGMGGGLNPEEKRERFSAIDARLRRLRARRELLWRESESPGEIAAHDGRGGEYLLRTDADLAQIAEGKEAA